MSHNTQTELAQKIGSTQKLISDYERGRVRPHPEILIKLAMTFNITTDELLGITALRINKTKPNRRILQRMEKIERLSLSELKFVLRAIDALLTASETKHSQNSIK